MTRRGFLTRRSLFAAVAGLVAGAHKLGEDAQLRSVLKGVEEDAAKSHARTRRPLKYEISGTAVDTERAFLIAIRDPRATGGVWEFARKHLDDRGIIARPSLDPGLLVQL